MKTKNQMIEEIKASSCLFVRYGKNLDMIIKKEDAISDISSMKDEAIGDWYPVGDEELIDIIRDEGKLVDSTCEGTIHMFLFRDEEYVVYEGIVTTREKDEEFGEGWFQEEPIYPVPEINWDDETE